MHILHAGDNKVTILALMHEALSLLASAILAFDGPVSTHACIPVIGCSNLPLVSEVARSLDFAPALHELANQIIFRLTKDGQLSYNAAHLRIEKDARDWSIIMGGDGVSPSFVDLSSECCLPNCSTFLNLSRSQTFKYEEYTD